MESTGDTFDVFFSQAVMGGASESQDSAVPQKNFRPPRAPGTKGKIPEYLPQWVQGYHSFEKEKIRADFYIPWWIAWRWPRPSLQQRRFHTWLAVSTILLKMLPPGYPRGKLYWGTPGVPSIFFYLFTPIFIHIYLTCFLRPADILSPQPMPSSSWLPCCHSIGGWQVKGWAPKSSVSRGQACSRSQNFAGMHYWPIWRESWSREGLRWVEGHKQGSVTPIKDDGGGCVLTYHDGGVEFGSGTSGISCAEIYQQGHDSENNCGEEEVFPCTVGYLFRVT